MRRIGEESKSVVTVSGWGGEYECENKEGIL